MLKPTAAFRAARLVVVALLMAVLLTPAALAQEEGFTPLFDGQTLEGWHNPYDWGEAEVVEGEIRLTADRKFFLVTDEKYGDFVFEAEVKMPEGEANSGFMFRAHEEPNRVWGYQAEVDPSDRKWSGGLYDEGRRGWLNPLDDQPEAQEAFDRHGWNHYRIKCVGDRLQVWVNGVKTTDYRDPLDVAGHLALQHHGEDGQVYRFRNIRVKELGRHEWKPLFNGENLSGWHTKPGGQWRVEDGVIVGTSPESESRHGLLVSDERYDDFTVRVRFRAIEGNSGFYFRSEEVDGAVGVHGFQAEVEPGYATGGLYETGGRAWVVQPDPEEVEAVYEPGEWTELVVSAHGRDVVVHVNGKKTAELEDDPGRTEGRFALQLHGGQEMHVEYKDIEILRPVE